MSNACPLLETACLLLITHRVNRNISIRWSAAVGKYINTSTTIFAAARYISLPFNSLLPGDTIRQHWAVSTLVQVMVCCQTATSHYLNQFDLSWHRSSDIDPRAFSPEMPQPSTISRQPPNLNWKLLIFNFIEIVHGPIFRLKQPRSLRHMFYVIQKSHKINTQLLSNKLWFLIFTFNVFLFGQELNYWNRAKLRLWCRNCKQRKFKICQTMANHNELIARKNKWKQDPFVSSVIETKLIQRSEI